MIKQTLSAGLLAIVASFAIGSIAVHAEEIMPLSEQPVSATDCANNVDGETDATTDCPDKTTDSTTSVTEPTDQDQTSTPDNAPEEIIVEEDEELIEEEPAMWPVYISLGALGLAILVFIILNLFGGKRK